MGTVLTSPDVLIALAIGLVPSFFWLFIWVRTDKENPEPFGLLMFCFILGGISVLFATYLQQAATPLAHTANAKIVIYAGIEEVLKFAVFSLIALHNDYNDEALDPAIYMIVTALGFAALENIFYVLKPGLGSNITAGLLTGTLRFFGSTLLHTIASCFVGISIGLMAKQLRFIAVIFGLAGAIFLHATFNFFILKNDTASALQIYGYLWVAAIISHVILEKLRRIKPVETPVTV